MFGKSELNYVTAKLDSVKASYNRTLGAINYISEERYELCISICGLLENVEKLNDISLNQTAVVSAEMQSKIDKVVCDFKRSFNEFTGTIQILTKEYESLTPRQRNAFLDNMAGAMVGDAVGAAAVNGVMRVASTFGKTSGGVPIGSLTGAAKTTATLAKIGGGSVASGGTGIAGGVGKLNTVASVSSTFTTLALPILIEYLNNKVASDAAFKNIKLLVKQNKTLLSIKEELHKDLKVNSARFRKVRDKLTTLHTLSNNKENIELPESDLDDLILSLQKLINYVDKRIAI